MKKIARALFGKGSRESHSRDGEQIAKQLAAEASQRREPAPPGFHDRVMSAVKSEPSLQESGKSETGQSWEGWHPAVHSRRLDCDELSRVEAVAPALKFQKRSGRSALPFRLATAGAVAAAVALLLFVTSGRFGSTDQTAAAPDLPAGMGAFDYLGSPEAAEAFLHRVAMESFAAEYESLSRDAVAAREFIRSSTTMWFEGTD